MPTPARPFVSYLGRGNGNGHGSPPPENDGERLARVEESLTRLQTMMETQFKRMAEMQVLIDGLTAERNR